MRQDSRRAGRVFPDGAEGFSKLLRAVGSDSVGEVTEKAVAYTERRGIPWEAVKEIVKIDESTPRRPLALPLRDAAGEIVGTERHAISDEVDPKVKADLDSTKTGSTFGALSGDRARVWILEGLMDYVAAEAMAGRLGVEVLGVPGAGLAVNAIKARAELLRGKTVFLSLDNDEEGRKATKAAHNALEQVGARPATAAYPPGFKDLCEITEKLGLDGAAGVMVEILTKAEPPRLVVSAAEFLAEIDEIHESLCGDALLVARGGYTIVSGETGVGKTILLGGLLVSLGAGREQFLGLRLPGVPVTVLILEAEGSRGKFRKRMKSIAESYGLDLAALPVFFHERSATLSIGQLAAMIKECGARAVLLDAIGYFHDAEENSATEWKNAVTKPLKQISEETGCAIALCDHHVKPSEIRSGKYKLRGTSAKLADCGAALRLEFGKGGRASRVLIFDRVRDGEAPDPLALSIDIAVGHVEIDPEGSTEAVDENAADQRREKQRLERSELAQQTLDEVLRLLEKEKDYDPAKGASERRLSDESGLTRTARPFKDGLAALAAQKAIERTPGGGWRRTVRL